MKKNSEDVDRVDPGFVRDDPWKKLSQSERKKAERHLYMLYAAMILLAVLPFIFLYFVLRRS